MTSPSKMLAACAVEGAVDYSCGRPITWNPYNKGLNPAAFASWKYGYVQAGTLLDLYGREEARRWLSTPESRGRNRADE